MNRSVKPQVRIFLVGCPRSGTTLLQSLLAAHPQVASFPEAHFFRHLLGGRKSWQQRFRLASSTARSRFQQFLDEVGHPEMKRYLPPYAIFTLQYVWAFINVLDDLTFQQEKNIWLEKTPSNLHYISYIEKRVPKAKFIHIIREGSDVVASLYEVTHKYPDIWTGAWEIDRCIQQWNSDVRRSLNYLNSSNHILVRYESLIASPEDMLVNICNFITIEYNALMLKNYRTVAKQVTLSNEDWKLKNIEEITPVRHHKFHSLFDEDSKNYILQQTSKLNLDRIYDFFNAQL